MSPSVETFKTTARRLVKGLHRHRERDELRRELDQARKEVESWQAINAATQEHFNRAIVQRDEARAEVERLATRLSNWIISPDPDSNYTFNRDGEV